MKINLIWNSYEFPTRSAIWNWLKPQLDIRTVDWYFIYLVLLSAGAFFVGLHVGLIATALGGASHFSYYLLMVLIGALIGIVLSINRSYNKLNDEADELVRAALSHQEQVIEAVNKIDEIMAVANSLYPTPSRKEMN